MPDYPALTMAELEAAWQRLTADAEADHYRAVLAAIEINSRTYAMKPPHASTYNARNALAHT